VKQTAATEFTNYKQIRKLILARSVGEWLASRSGHFNSEEKSIDSNFIGWVDTRCCSKTQTLVKR